MRYGARCLRFIRSRAIEPAETLFRLGRASRATTGPDFLFTDAAGRAQLYRAGHGVLLGGIGPERLGDQLGVHVLANLLDQPVLKSKGPAVVVVVSAAVGHFVGPRVLDEHVVAVSVNVADFDSPNSSRRREDPVAIRLQTHSNER
jgi:hypothetical protein